MRRALVAAMAAVIPILVSFNVQAQDGSNKTYQQLELFGTVFDRVRADYVEDVGEEDLIESAINGMLTSLDPHSSYLNAKSFRDMRVQTRGEFGGLGIEVTMENGLVKVVSPIDDTPAFRAGLKPGDLITHLDKTNVQGLSLAEAVEKMRGPVNTDLLLTIRRTGREPFEVTITRAVIKIQSVRSRNEGDIGYLRITSFSEQTAIGVARAMKKLHAGAEKSLKGLILDLRNNPGGLLDQSVKVADAFLERGEIVSTRSRRPDDAQRFNSKPGDLAQSLPMIVLINGGSASASEIVAGALQDHRRAIVLGTKSFGKGSVQTIIPLAGHGAMRLTTARYYTPSGRSIQAKGIDPDIIVQQARIENIDIPRLRSEKDLRGALSNPNDRKKEADKPKQNQADKPASGKTAEKKEPPQDYQLARALDLLRGLALYQDRTAK